MEESSRHWLKLNPYKLKLLKFALVKLSEEMSVEEKQTFFN